MANHILFWQLKWTIAKEFMCFGKSWTPRRVSGSHQWKYLKLPMRGLLFRACTLRASLSGLENQSPPLTCSVCQIRIKWTGGKSGHSTWLWLSQKQPFRRVKYSRKLPRHCKYIELRRKDCMIALIRYLWYTWQHIVMNKIHLFLTKLKKIKAKFVIWRADQLLTPLQGS